MSEKRFALIIANDQYHDKSLRELEAPQIDADALAKVLGDPGTCNFLVQFLLNKRSHEVEQAIENFFSDRDRDDLLLLYFSGHGLKDEEGKLYFATSDTRRDMLMSTAVSASFVNDLMRRTRSRRQVLLLDCCFSGAFARGMIAKSGSAVGSSIGTSDYFQGRGRVILTASDAMQYAFEEDELVEEGAVRSIFTSAILDGIESWKADNDRDDRISIDELYDYVDSYVHERTPHQRPSMWSFETQGEIIIAEREHISDILSDEQIIVEGRNDPDIDAQAVQDAVDNYDEVVLRGTFNLGTSMVQISRSVAVKGEGRENDIPSTTIYKKGWRFPFTEFDSVFRVEGEDADVTIENIQFTDFNHTCIMGVQCNSLNIKENRITLMTGYGRGLAYGAFGDTVIGIWIRGSELSAFKGRVTIEGNYIDFARGGAFGGFLTRGGLEEDPEYRPDLFNHEYYMGFGVAVQQASGAVIIENNVIRNANARGIAATDNLPSADVRIRNNSIVSDLYGSYPLSSQEAGGGILVQSAWGFPEPGFKVEIEDNTIRLDKLNHSGITILGAVMDREGADKLRGGLIRNNCIRLKDGYEGIHVRRCDDFKVIDNTISGEAYYGIRLSGRRRSGEHDLRALNNTVEGNDMGDLRIRDPDEYSNEHADGRRFAGSPGGSATAHVWLGKFSGNNVIKIGKDQTVIDEGEENKILSE